MSTIHVALATLPPLLRDIVRETLVRDPDVEIVAEIGRTNEIEASSDRVAADVLIVGVAPADWSGLSSLTRELLTRHPGLTIIALARDGRSGYVYQQPRGLAIHDISPKSLVQLIRSTAGTGLHPSIHPFSAE